MFTAKWRRRAAVIVAASAAMAIVLSGCSGGGDPADKGGASGSKKAESLVLTAPAPPNSYDLATGADWATRSAYMQAVYDTLLREDPDGKIEPWLAVKWSYNADNTVLTLKIRKDVTFTDGTKLDAAAVQQNLERIKNGSSGSAPSLKAVKSVTAPDADTVELTLTSPDPALVTNLARGAGLVSSPAAFTAPNAATDPVGSGPYILDTSKTVGGTSYVYKANPKYWNKSVQYYNTLTIKVTADPTATMNTVRAGEANGVLLGDTKTLDQVKAAGWKANAMNANVQGLLLFDRDGTMNPALKDVRVRQAINYAFDRKGMLTALQGGVGDVTDQMFPPSSPAYDKALDNAYPFDPKKAKKLLADAGYGDGLTIAMPNSTRVPAAQWNLVAQQLSDVGITIEYTDPGTSYLADMLSKYPMGWLPIGQDTDWAMIELLIAPDAQFNPLHITNDTVSGLIDEVRTGTPDEQHAAAKKLNKYVVDQAWFAPWYRQSVYFATDSKTTVPSPDVNGYPSLYDIRPAN